MVMTILISLRRRALQKRYRKKLEILVYRILFYEMMYYDISKKHLRFLIGIDREFVYYLILSFPLCQTGYI